MPSLVVAHSVGLLFATGAAAWGWYMAHHPAQALRLFTFGSEPLFGKKFGLAFCKVCGWFFFVFMSVGGISYGAAIIMDVLHRG